MRRVVLFGSCVSVILAGMFSSARAQERETSRRWANLTVDKRFYETGETVGFTFTNLSSRTFIVSNSSWSVSRGRTMVFVPPRTVGAFPLRTGHSWTRTWNMKDNRGRTVSPGVYTLHFVLNGTQGNLAEHADFDVVKKSTGGLVVRMTKSRYQQGETVRFYAINRNVEDLYIPSSAPFWIERRKSGGTWGRAFSPIGLMYIVSFPPGSRRMWSWDQAGDEGKPVGAGKYRVNLRLGAYRREFIRNFKIVD